MVVGKIALKGRVVVEPPKVRSITLVALRIGADVTNIILTSYVPIVVHFAVYVSNPGPIGVSPLKTPKSVSGFAAPTTVPSGSSTSRSQSSY